MSGVAARTGECKARARRAALCDPIYFLEAGHGETAACVLGPATTCRGVPRLSRAELGFARGWNLPDDFGTLARARSTGVPATTPVFAAFPLNQRRDLPRAEGVSLAADLAARWGRLERARRVLD